MYRVWVRSFAGFWGVLLLLLQFDFWIWGRAGFWLGWAVLGWAVFLFALEFDFGILGTAGGFCFLLLPFWLGWAGLPLGLAGLGSPHARFRENSKRMKMQYEAKLTQFLFILLLRV